MISEVKYNSHDEWLKIRSQYIGGSDAGAVIGMNPYKSAYTLWAEKTGRVPQFDGNIVTKVGSYLEDFVAKLFEEETGKKVRRKNRTILNTACPWACANIDRVVLGENAILEIKTSTSIPTIRKVKSGEPADAWYCQVQHYMAVGGYDIAYIAVLVNCRELVVFTIPRDEADIAILMKAEEAFMDCVKTDTPPGIDGSESSKETVSGLYPESTDEVVDLSAYGTSLDEYMALGRQIKEMETRRDAIGNTIKSHMENAGRGDSGNYQVTWTSSDRKSFDSKSFAKENPEIDLNPYYKTTTVRTFKVTERKGA